MSNLENRFKTASMGGFVKKEVISYIESMEQEYRTKLRTLERIVAATQVARGELESEIGERGNESEQLKAIIIRAQEQLNAREGELRAALAEVERLQGANAGMDTMEIQILAASKEIEVLKGREAELRHQLTEQSMNMDAEAQATIAALRTELASQSAMIQQLQQENAELREKLEKMPTTGGASSISSELLLDLQTQLDQRNRQVIQMNVELELMRDKCLSYEKTVDALENMQTKANQIEAEAHEKAAKLMSTASQESDKMKSDLDQWLKEIEESYQKTKMEAEEKMTRAYAELEKTKAAIDKLTAEKEEEELYSKRPPLSVITSRYVDAKNA